MQSHSTANASNLSVVSRYRPNPAHSGADVASGAPTQTASLLRIMRAREAKPVRATLKKLAEAHAKALAANAAEASEAQVRRANATVDRAYDLPVQSIEEFACLLRLALTSDGESMDAPYRHAIERVAAGLAAMCVPASAAA